MRPGVAIAILCGLVIATVALLVALGPCTQDDAYISFRYAANLVEGHGLVYNPGERVEGFTNFLWTVMIAGGMALGAEPAALSRALGIAAVVALVVTAWALAARADRERRVTGGLVAAAIAAASPAIAIEGVQGLETVFFAWLVTLGAGLAATSEERRERGECATKLAALAGLVLAAAGLTRPEGLGVLGLCAIAIGLRRWRAGERIFDKSLACFAGAFFALWIPYWALRWNYYGWPLPNTFYAKTGGGWRHVEAGLAYEWAFVRMNALLVGLAVAAAIAAWFAARATPRSTGQIPPTQRARATPLAWVAGCVVLGYAGYVVTIGGDFKATFRFLVPFLGLLAVLVDGWVGASLRHFTEGASARAPLARCAGLALALALVIWNGARLVRPALAWCAGRRAYAEQGGAAGRWLAANAPSGATLAIHAAGVIPYFARIPTIDMYGLTDPHIAHLPMPGSKGAAGHEKGDPRHVFERRPTFYVHDFRSVAAAPFPTLAEDVARDLGVPEVAERYRARAVEIVVGEGDSARPMWFSFLERID